MKLIYLKLMALFLIAIIPVALFNYLIDPYGIFKNSSLDLWYSPGYEPNQHYAKMRHIINDKHSWDSYLFGSSRVGKINPALISSGSYYNMNYSEGIPGEHLLDIEILLKNRIPVKNIIIGLDNFSYTLRPKDHRDQIMRHHYDGSFFERLFFQIKYLCSEPVISIINNRKSENNNILINFNILGNGMHNLERADKNIEENIELHVKSDRFNEANNIPFDKSSESKYLNLMENAIRDIRVIVKLSRKYNFNLHIFLNPTHFKYYLQGNPYHFLLFKEKLAQVISYWDFSGFNTITTNNYYWYETSHYRTMVGDLITCRMFKCTNIDVPEDFGVFVTKDNVSLHIIKQKNQLTAMKKSNLNDNVGKQ